MDSKSLEPRFSSSPIEYHRPLLVHRVKSLRFPESAVLRCQRTGDVDDEENLASVASGSTCVVNPSRLNSVCTLSGDQSCYFNFCFFVFFQKSCLTSKFDV